MEAMVLNGARRRREDERLKEAFVTVMFALGLCDAKLCAPCPLVKSVKDMGLRGCQP